VKIESRRAEAGFWLGPIRDFYVVFWRQPRLAESELPAGGQEQVMWAADEHSVSDADDVNAVIEWAEDEGRRRRATYTLYAVASIGAEEGLVWLAGVDPTRGLGGPNFERTRPAGVDPVGGTPADVYGPADAG
jgi:hypothetical protein